MPRAAPPRSFLMETPRGRPAPRPGGERAWPRRPLAPQRTNPANNASSWRPPAAARGPGRGTQRRRRRAGATEREACGHPASALGHVGLQHRALKSLQQRRRPGGRPGKRGDRETKGGSAGSSGAGVGGWRRHALGNGGLGGWVWGGPATLLAGPGADRGAGGGAASQDRSTTGARPIVPRGPLAQIAGLLP